MEAWFMLTAETFGEVHLVILTFDLISLGRHCWNLDSDCTLSALRTILSFSSWNSQKIYSRHEPTQQVIQILCKNKSSLYITHDITGKWWTIYIPVSPSRVKISWHCRITVKQQRSHIPIKILCEFLYFVFHSHWNFFFNCAIFIWTKQRHDYMELAAFHGHSNEVIKLLGQRPQFTENNTSLLFLILLS